MSKELKAFLKKIESGWSPPPIPKEEYLRRVRLQVEALLEKSMQVAEGEYPGIGEMLKWLIAKEAELAKEVAGAAELGGLS